jgi:hypothetical protein
MGRISAVGALGVQLVTFQFCVCGSAVCQDVTAFNVVDPQISNEVCGVLSEDTQA